MSNQQAHDIVDDGDDDATKDKTENVSEESHGVKLELFQSPCQLVGAAGATTFAVNSFQKVNYFINLPTLAEPCKALGVSVTTLDNLNSPDHIAFGFKVDMR